MPSLPRRVFASLLAVFVLAGGSFSLQGQTVTSSLQEIAGLKLNCPVPLVEKPMQGALPADGPVKEMLRYDATAEGAEINVSSILYQDGITVNLDGAINGAVASVSKVAGVSDAKHSVEEVPMAGVTAKRLTVTAKRGGDELCMTAVYILQGQKMWVVQALFSGSDRRARFVGETVVKSVRGA